MDRRDVQISKTLSYLLRHGAVKEKLPIDLQGWIEVADILKQNRVKSHKTTVEDIERIVAENNKQRFALKHENDKIYICANQGHSLTSVTPDLELLTAETMPANVYHGTLPQSLAAIRETGLSRMQRNHIHFTSDAEWSKLGIRASSTVLIYIDTAKLVEDGYQFYRSKNGVILCAGNEQGMIPAQYILKVETREAGRNTGGKS